MGYLYISDYNNTTIMMIAYITVIVAVVMSIMMPQNNPPDIHHNQTWTVIQIIDVTNVKKKENLKKNVRKCIFNENISLKNVRKCWQKRCCF